MNRERYDLIRNLSGKRYDFFSKGPKGVIWKAIQFDEISVNRFNLSFGDWNNSLQRIDDKARSHNLDRDKLFNTIAYVVIEFLERFSTSRVIARGSTHGRTRLYQIAIKENWFEINEMVNVYGYLNGAWHIIDKDKNYDAFMVSAKNNFLI